MAEIKRLRTRAERLRQADGQSLRQMVLDYAAGRAISDRAVGEIVSAIDRETAASSNWTFVMVSPETNAAIVEWLLAHSSRPHLAVRLWSRLFLYLRHDTCEVVQTRDELAATMGVAPGEVSRVMTELEGIGAISRRREGKGVRYYMNPLVGSHLTGVARVKAQRLAPTLRLVPAE